MSVSGPHLWYKLSTLHLFNQTLLSLMGLSTGPIKNCFSDLTSRLTALSPVVCSCRVMAIGEAWSGVGADLVAPRVVATDRGAGKDAFSGEGREAFSVVCGFRASLELLGLLSGLSSDFTDLLFTQEEEEPA